MKRRRETSSTRRRDIYGYPHFVNDTSGSICELEDDPGTLEVLAEHSLILYLRADDSMEDELDSSARWRHPEAAVLPGRVLRGAKLDALPARRTASTHRRGHRSGSRSSSWIFPEARRPSQAPVSGARRSATATRSRRATIEGVRDESDFHELVVGALGEGAPSASAIGLDCKSTGRGRFARLPPGEVR